MPTAAIAGATGLVGRAVLEQLAKDPHFDRVVVLARRPAPTPHAPKIDWRVVDFDAEPPYLELASDAPDAVFCCLGTTREQTPDPAQYKKIDHDYPVRLCAAT